MEEAEQREADLQKEREVCSLIDFESDHSDGSYCVSIFACVCVCACVASAVSCEGAAGSAAVYLEICGCSEAGLPRYENGC